MRAACVISAVFAMANFPDGLDQLFSSPNWVIVAQPVVVTSFHVSLTLYESEQFACFVRAPATGRSYVPLHRGKDQEGVMRCPVCQLELGIERRAAEIVVTYSFKDWPAGFRCRQGGDPVLCDNLL